MKARRAFTLVEMLVVIAIIALLAALIIPAINSARASARSTQASSNLRQLTMAWIQYAEVQGDMVPWLLWDPAKPQVQRYWFATVIDDGVNPPQLDFDRGLLAPYLEQDPEVFQDPDFSLSSITETRFNTLTSAFGYNASYLGPGTSIQYDENWNWVGVYQPGSIHPDSGKVVPPPAHAFASLKATSKTIVFADSARGYNSDFSPGLTENWLLDPPSSGNPTTHYRHVGDIAHVSFADGHVKKFRWVENELDVTTLPSYWDDDARANFYNRRLGFVGTTDALYDRDIEEVD